MIAFTIIYFDSAQNVTRTEQHTVKHIQDAVSILERAQTKSARWKFRGADDKTHSELCNAYFK